MNTEQRQLHEADLSAVIDGELDGEPLRLAIDALVEDSSLRDFWKQSRGLQATLANPDDDRVGVSPSPDLWKKIEKETNESTLIVSLKRLPMRSLAAAATILLVVSLTLSGLLRIDLPFGQSNGQSVNLAGERGSMDEQRFIDLTTELLQADPRYHRKMLEVMELVNEQAYGYETAGNRRPVQQPQLDDGVESDAQPNEQGGIAPARSDDPPRSERGSNMELTLW